jgi:hypothetical protein
MFTAGAPRQGAARTAVGGRCRACSPGFPSAAGHVLPTCGGSFGREARSLGLLRVERAVSDPSGTEPGVPVINEVKHQQYQHAVAARQPAILGRPPAEAGVLAGAADALRIRSPAIPSPKNRLRQADCSRCIAWRRNARPGRAPVWAPCCQTRVPFTST